MKALGIPVKLETYWIRDNRSNASKLEAEIKGLSKENKEKLLLGDYRVKN
jgi:predicted GIY-YIG superfamily endonuclease